MPHAYLLVYYKLLLVLEKKVFYKVKSNPRLPFLLLHSLFDQCTCQMLFLLTNSYSSYKSQLHGLIPYFSQDHVNLAWCLPVTVLLKLMCSRWVVLIPLTWSRSTLHIWAVPMSRSKKIMLITHSSNSHSFRKVRNIMNCFWEICDRQKSLIYKQHRKCKELCQKL